MEDVIDRYWSAATTFLCTFKIVMTLVVCLGLVSCLLVTLTNNIQLFKDTLNQIESKIIALTPIIK